MKHKASIFENAMKQSRFIQLLLLVLSFTISACSAQENMPEKVKEVSEQEIKEELQMGAEVLLHDLSALQDKKVAMMVNQTSVVGDQHIVDLLLEKGVQVKAIFAPEHGFRGKADAGEKVKDGMDTKTGLPIISLYGSHKKPSTTDLAGVDLVIFDIQDVGVRFYTYISSLHYLMQACAEQDIALMVLDRPNPNGYRVDGNILDMDYTSFVGMHPVPILHGMTVGEYAQMMQGEGWLGQNLTCDLSVVSCKGYQHKDSYSLPIKPSPNLADDRAVFCYPSTCFFEGTVISEGRGTDKAFTVFGAPNIDEAMTSYSFIPKSIEGAKYPKFENKTCYGFNIHEIPNDFEEEQGINLNYLITMYNLYPNKESFFLSNGFFDTLAGGDELRKDIVAGKTVEEIKASWQEGLQAFKETRKKYLLYPDFE